MTRISPETEHVTRRNPEMERYVEIAPVVMEGFPDAHNVFLQVTNQRFQVGAFACETKDDAEWMRDMLCIALAKVRSDGVAQTPAEPHETTYLRGWNEGVERAAEVAEKLYEKPGWSPHYQNAAGAIAKLIRALSDTSTEGNGK